MTTRTYPIRRHVRHVMRTYKVSQDEASALLWRAGEGCEVCGGDNVDHSTAGRLCIDHDHATGKVRGVLCSRCNRILGAAKDDPSLLRRLADYLECAVAAR